MQEITIVGGGLAGLTAAIACAEQGAPVRLLEAHDELGGRARSTDGPYKANLGPHALLASSPVLVVAGRARAAAARTRGRRCPASASAGRTTSAGCLRSAPRWRRCGCAAGRRRWIWTSARGRLTASAQRRPTRWRAAPGSSPITTTPASCRLHSCGRRSSAGCCRRRPRRDSRSEGGRGSSIAPRPCALARRRDRDRRAGHVAARGAGDHRHRARRRARAAGRRVADLAERQRRMPRSRARAIAGATRSSSSISRRPAGWSATPRPTSRSPRRRGADPGADADPPRRIRRVGAGAARASARRLVRRLARARVTWRRRQVMDGRTGALDLPGKTWRDRPRGRPRRRRIPGRRHGRGAGLPVGDRLGQRDRGQPAGGRRRRGRQAHCSHRPRRSSGDGRARHAAERL